MTTEIYVVSVAGNYTITFGNIFGANRRIVGKGNKAEAVALATLNAKSNGLNKFWLRVGRGDFVLQHVSN